MLRLMCPIFIKMAKDEIMKKIWLESDSLNIINCLTKKVPPSWTIKFFIEDRKYMFNLFEESKISHIFCDGNYVADRLANIGVMSQQWLNWDINNHIHVYIQILYSYTMMLGNVNLCPFLEMMSLCMKTSSLSRVYLWLIGGEL